jgi:Na+-driven multidrug efflux pump
VLTTIANSMGVNASAAVGIVGKYNGFAILPAIAVGSSVSAMVAQNMGAGAIDRAKKTFYTGFACFFNYLCSIYYYTEYSQKRSYLFLMMIRIQFLPG